MKEAIKDLLNEWSGRLSRQNADMEASNPTDDHDHYLDRHLFGAALFIKEIAHKESNIELLGIASKIELDLKERFLAEDAAYEEYDRDRMLSYEIEQNVRKECIKHFFNEPKFRVDISKYNSLIEANKEKITDESIISSLEKYLDPEKALKKIYNDVKHTLQFKFSTEKTTRLPDVREIREEFDRELLDFYRRADNTVLHRLNLPKR